MVFDGLQDFLDPDSKAEHKRLELANWFEPNDWELQSSKIKILETPQCKLLFDDYQPRDDGLIEIKPCSMVFLSRDPTADAESLKRRAIVLRAPQGALL